MAENSFDFNDLLSKLNFSDPIDGTDLIKWILGVADSDSLSGSIKKDISDPLFEQLKTLYGKVSTKISSTMGNADEISRLSEPLRLDLVQRNLLKGRQDIQNVASKVSDKLVALHKKIGEEVDSNTESRSKAMADPLGILDVRKEYKRKVKGVLTKAFDSLKTKNIEEASENISKESSEKERPSRYTELKTVESTEKTNPPQTKEQKSMIEKNIVSLSDETLAALAKIGVSVDSKNILGLEKILKKLKISEHEDTPKEDSGGGGGWIGKILGALLLGGLAVTVIATFWKDHIKPWIEEKIGYKLDFFDKFKGIFEGLGKWLTLGAGGAAGFALKIGGQIFETAGEVGEKMIEGVFKAMLGEGAEKGLSAGAVKLLSGATVKKIFGKALGGVGKAALKGIPIIGALISLGFAVDNFMNGNYVQGSLDLLNGAVGLIPGVGIPLSLGVSALQLFLEAKTLNLEGSEKNSAQAGLLGSGISSIFKGLWSVMRKAPLIEWFTNLGEGIWKLCNGDFKGGLNQLVDVPLIGALIAPFSAILDNVEYGEGGEMSGFNLSGFYKEFKIKMLRSLLSLVPTAFGMRYKLAEMMGIGAEYKQDEWKIENAESEKMNQKALIQSKNIPYSENRIDQEKEDIKRLEGDIEKTKKSIEENEKRGFEWTNMLGKVMKRDELDKTLGFLNSQLEFQKKLAESEKDKNPKEEKANDFFSPASNDFSFGSKTIYDPSTNTQTSLAPEDNVLAYKSGGAFDKTLNDIKNVVISMGKKISELNGSLSNQPSSINSVNVNNSSSSGGGNGSMSGKRDPIFDVRADYWRKYPNERAFI